MPKNCKQNFQTFVIKTPKKKLIDFLLLISDQIFKMLNTPPCFFCTIDGTIDSKFKQKKSRNAKKKQKMHVRRKAGGV